jgi:hypothetical protein
MNLGQNFKIKTTNRNEVFFLQKALMVGLFTVQQWELIGRTLGY